MKMTTNSPADVNVNGWADHGNGNDHERQPEPGSEPAPLGVDVAIGESGQVGPYADVMGDEGEGGGEDGDCDRDITGNENKNENGDMDEEWQMRNSAGFGQDNDQAPAQVQALVQDQAQAGEESRQVYVVEEGEEMHEPGDTMQVAITLDGRGPAQNSQGNEDSAPAPGAAYSLFDNPPNLRRIRQLLFELKDPTEISLEEYERYWPFIDNVWVKQRSNSTKDGHMTTDYYMCRLRRPTCKSSQMRPLPEGKKPRNKAIREGSACNVQIKVVRFEGAYSTVTISRTPGSSRSHSHDLEYMDRVKRNSGLLEFARREASKGYLPSSIFAKFREEPDKLYDAGGKFFNITDVRNISAKWRSMYPTASLKTHEGYSYQPGYGVVRLHDRPPLPQQALSSNQSDKRENNPPLPPDTLHFPTFDLSFLDPYLPQNDAKRPFPHVTLTYASSLDAKISLMPGTQTLLSGPDSKLMTHYLRSRHDALIIGVGTALADDPGLNCRLAGAGAFGGLGRAWQPRPIIIDPTARWPGSPDCRLLQTARTGKGKAPWVVVSPGAQVPPERLVTLKNHGGDYLRIVEYNPSWRLRWEGVLRALATEGIHSVMVEGGGVVLSELLNPEYGSLVDSLIVTIAPTYLGNNGVSVSPDSKTDATGRPVNALCPTDVKWQPLGGDIVMCGKTRIPEGGPMLGGVGMVAPAAQEQSRS